MKINQNLSTSISKCLPATSSKPSETGASHTGGPGDNGVKTPMVGSYCLSARAPECDREKVSPPLTDETFSSNPGTATGSPISLAQICAYPCPEETLRAGRVMNWHRDRSPLRHSLSCRLRTPALPSHATPRGLLPRLRLPAAGVK